MCVCVNIHINISMAVLLRPYVLTTSPFTRVKTVLVLLTLELWQQCSKNQLQNSSKNKNYLLQIIIQIATFNVRTLNRILQLPEQTASAIDHNIDIICIKELR